MTVTVTVDRIEGDTAVLEIAGRTVDWPLGSLPEGAREGGRYQVTFSPTSSDTSDAQARLDRLSAGSSDDDIIDL